MTIDEPMHGIANEASPSPSGSRPVRRLLFVSQYYAPDFSVCVGGVFRRMQVLLLAAQQAAETVDVLFFAEPAALARGGAAAAQASLRDCWGIVACVHVAPRATMRHGRWLQTLRALTDFQAQSPYFYFAGQAQRDAVSALVRDDTDLVVAHRLCTGGTVVAAVNDIVPIVMDLDDIEHRNRARWLATAPRSLASTVAKLELHALRCGELATLRRCRTSFVCSQTDQHYLNDAGVATVSVVPNAIPIGPTIAAFDAAAAPTLFFIGAYGYPPNVEAAEFLIGDVFPRVRAARPDARLLIVGAGVERLPSHGRGAPGVEFVGFVPDLTEVYRRATVVCCPIRSGGGTRIKIIEAAAAGRPIVSTTIGAEGLGFVDGDEIVLRDTPAGLADACVTLLNDRARAARLGAAAAVKARALYARDEVVTSIAHRFREAARR